MLRRLVNIFKRGESAIKPQQVEKTEITIKQGKKEMKLLFNDVKRLNIDVLDSKGKHFVLSTEQNLIQTKIEDIRSTSSKKEDNLLQTAKDFNDITNAVTKLTAGATVVGVTLLNNSKHQNSEVKRVANLKGEDIFDSDIF